MASDGDYNKQHDEGLKRVLQIAYLKRRGPRPKKHSKQSKSAPSKNSTSNAKPAKD